jgi:hypothetical protein
MTALDLPKDELMKLHERLVATARCEDVTFEPVFPDFDPPPGLEKEQDLYVQAWLDLDGWGYVLLRGSPSREWYDRMPSIPTLLPAVLDIFAAEAGLTNVKIESGPKSRNDRYVWALSAEEFFGLRVRVVPVLSYCTTEDVSFLMMHVGPEEQEFEAVLAPMLAARCPGQGAQVESQKSMTP